jgi:opacity protein-like surface antigen
MYTLHVGRRFDSALYGFNSALYLEVAYLDGDVDFNDPTGFGLLNRLNADINIVPVTLNGMMERNIYGGLGLYVGGGLGYAFTDIDAGNQSDSDGGFYAQLSAGLNYKFTETFEMFAGARWVYLNDLDFGDSTLELDDGFAWEVGLRFNF